MPTSAARIPAQLRRLRRSVGGSWRKHRTPGRSVRPRAGSRGSCLIRGTGTGWRLRLSSSWRVAQRRQPGPAVLRRHRRPLTRSLTPGASRTAPGIPGRTACTCGLGRSGRVPGHCS